MLGSDKLLLSRPVATNACENVFTLTLIRSDMPNVFTREKYPHRCLQGGRQGCQEIDMKLGLKKFAKELLLQNLFETFPGRKYLKGTCSI